MAERQLKAAQLPPSDPDEWPPPLEKILLTAQNWLESFLIECPDGEFRLSVGAFFFDEDGDPGHAIMVENTEGDKRDEFLDFVRLNLVSLDAHAYFVASETWSVQYDEGEKPTTTPSKSPKRVEKIMALAVNADKTIAMCRSILRDADGKVNGFGEVEEMANEVGGRMAHLLPKRPWPEGAQEIARLMLEIKHKPHTRSVEVPWGERDPFKVQ